MNATSLMAVSTADGSRAGTGTAPVRAVSVGSRTQTASGKNSFSDTFDALQKEVLTDVVNAAGNKTSRDTQDVTAETPGAAGEQMPLQSGNENQDEGTDLAQAIAVTPLIVDIGAANADADLEAPLAAILERYGLTAEQLQDTDVQQVQALLQQMSPTETAQTKNFLLALAGEPLVETAAAETAVQAPLTQLTEGRKASELVGESLIVSDNPDAPSPLDVLAQRTMRHEMMGQGAGGQQQDDAAQTQQLAFQAVEELVGETAQQAPRAAESSASSAPQPISAAPTGSMPMQNVVSAEPVQEAPPSPQADYEIPRQIVEQARLLRTMTDTQMVIRLKPEHLGELTLRVAVGADGSVQASFHSDNAHVRNVIENSLMQLRQELNNQGLKVDRVGVYTGLADGQMPQGQGQGAWQNAESGRGETRIYAHGDADDYVENAEEVVSISAAEQTVDAATTTDGVDYRV